MSIHLTRTMLFTLLPHVGIRPVIMTLYSYRARPLDFTKRSGRKHAQSGYAGAISRFPTRFQGSRYSDGHAILIYRRH
jgi:hypothetical protein